MSKSSSPAVAAWRAPSATAPTPIRPRWRWLNCRYCLLSGARTQKRWSSPTAPRAAIRSRTAPDVAPFTLPACWRSVSTARDPTKLPLPPQRNPFMAELTLDVARKILDAALAKGVEKKLKPLVVTVLDARGCVKASAAQDGTSLMRSEIAHGKAYGALAMGMGSRALFQRAQEQAYFVSAVNTMAQGRLIPVPGGVLIQDGGVLLGAVGVSGDTSDNDEICAIAGIEAAGLKANPG